MVGEALSRSSSVIVHSQYARKKLVAVHGDHVGAKVAVIPHFAKKMPISATGRRAARSAPIRTAC